MSARIAPGESIREIRCAVDVIALLHSGDQLSAADLRAFVKIVHEELDTLAAAVQAPRDLPILTLGEVAARAKHRTEPAARPRLQLVEGGAA